MEQQIEWTEENKNLLIERCKNMNAEFLKGENIFRTDLITGADLCQSLLQQGKLPLSIYLDIHNDILIPEQ